MENLVVTQFFRKNADGTETCFHVVTDGGVAIQHVERLRMFFREFPGQAISMETKLKGKRIVEAGTRPSYYTPWSTNAVSALQVCGLPILRIEEARRTVLSSEANASFVAGLYDRATEAVYPSGETQFLVNGVGGDPEPVFTVPVLKRGGEVLAEVSEEYGLAFDPGLIQHFVGIFRELGRDPTIVELFQIGQMCSDHSRHITWSAQLKLGGEIMPFTLFDLAKAPYKERIKRGVESHLIAFHDNASAIQGFSVVALVVDSDGKYVRREETRHLVAGAETHNYPTTVSADPGAITGLVGCYRDPQATGRGGVLLFSSAGYSTGLLRIPGYHIPGEEFVPDVYPEQYETPLGIKLGAPRGAWRGGNQCGVPVLHGFSRSVELMVGSEKSERYGYLKTIMYAGNTAYILEGHQEKKEATAGLLIVQIGGGANPVGLGGAAGSSQILGAQDIKLDLDAVQRGNPQMARKVANVLRRCVELGERNPIDSIHDQGAGGPCNVVTELIETTGGRVRLYEINLDDPKMSTVQIWCAEYQERQGLLISPENLELFAEICDDEDCPLEVLGETTGDGKIVVFATPEEELQGKASVDLSIQRVVSGLPETILEDEEVAFCGRPFEIPDGLTLPRAFEIVVAQEDVGSKDHLVHRVDRSVGGLVARQQCCGPLQLPVADVAVSALTHFSSEGMAAALGEQPLIMMLNPEAGGRMALVEALTNLMFARITDFDKISFSANWMLAARAPGGLCKLYRAATSLKELSLEWGIAQDGGKDSSSLAMKVDEELVKSPETLVCKIYAPIADVTKVLTPDIQTPGESTLIHVDFADGKRRLGGSAFAQALGQIGEECPDLDDPAMLKRFFKLMLEFIDQDLILSGHDTTADGVLVTLAEMAFSGNCGLEIDIPGKEGVFAEMFAKEAGLILEVSNENAELISRTLVHKEIPFCVLGKTTKEKEVRISHQGLLVLSDSTDKLCQQWRETAYQIERLQINSECADAEKANRSEGLPPVYNLTFKPQPTAPEIFKRFNKPKVAILRDQGTNGEREMAAAFDYVGFDAREILVKQLVSGKKSLEGFSGLVWCGGFSYMDVFVSGKAVAMKVLLNERLGSMFQAFRNNPATWSLGVCNGDQIMKRMNWLYPDMGDNHPLSVQNVSKAFESRWVNVQISENTKAMMLQEMAGSSLGIYVAHGEGQFWTPNGDPSYFLENGLVGMQYIAPDGKPTTQYPFNPNGSVEGIASLCSPCGRHLVMMPHPERSFRRFQWPWMPREWSDLKASPWIQMFQTARENS